MSKKTDKVQELENKVNELDAQLKRAVADYQNLEKRVSEGRSELTRWGISELLTKMLPVLDHLEQVVDLGRATLSEQSESKGWFQGVELAVKQFSEVLKSEGLDEIIADGLFDPSLHEAVDTHEGENGIILEVVRKGYNLNGKVLRPAQVVVGRSQDNHPEERNSDEGSIKEES